MNFININCGQQQTFVVDITWNPFRLWILCTNCTFFLTFKATRISFVAYLRPTSIFFPVYSVKYLSKSLMTSNINHTNEQLPCTENHSELKEVLKPCGKLPPTNDIKLDRSYFKRKVPMIFVGIQCDKHVKTSLEKLKPFFCPFIRLPKISKT